MLFSLQIISAGIILCPEAANNRLEGNFVGSEHEIEVSLKLHLIMPNAGRRKSPVYTIANYQECFSLIRESALFEFGAFNIAHDIVIQDTTELMLSKNCIM